MHSKDPIGIFDSGLGGISVLQTLVQELPEEDIIYFGDSKYNPYGTKSKEEITQRCLTICDTLMEKKVKAIIVACNTATSACIPILRQKYPIDIVGMEPALKLACSYGKRQKIAVWATTYTLQEQKFAGLMQRFQDEHEIYKVACPKLVQLVEKDLLEDQKTIKAVLQEYIDQSHIDTLDSIVLGCTHFVFFKEILRSLLPDSIQIVDGNLGTVHHTQDLLKQKGLLNHEHEGTITWINTDPSKIEQSKQLLQHHHE